MNHAVNDGSVYLLSSLFPIVIANYGLSVLQVGVLVGAGYLVSVVGQPIVGRYSEGADPRKLLALGIGIISVSVLSFVLSTDFSSLLASVVLLRVGSSFFHPVGVSAVSRTYAGAGLDRAMGIQSAFGNFGIFSVFVSAAPVYLAFGWKTTFILFALLGVLDVAVTLAILKVPTSADRRPGERVDPQVPQRGLLGTPLFFLAVTFISGACFALIVNYTNILLQSESHLAVFTANVAVAGWIGFAFLGAVSTGRWPRVIRRSSLLALAFLVSASTIVALSFVANNPLLAVPVLLVNGFMLSATYPLTYSELSEFLENSPDTKGRSFGAIFSSQTIGGSVFGLLSGYLAVAFGLTSAYLAAGLLMFAGAVISLNWARRRKVDDESMRLLKLRNGVSSMV
jgi:MFS transporter, FSR family, fosmidomycin resistance protein